ncbi:hypothetical protein EW026_g7237 [Hermanssonia centrifuga]|uniref:Uncharacterized protein n=1 Tax=Hermanssonia centrifuga TaxID=98765 RepID=A0A4S4K8K4_9APHY|nr:hypothetical protein EW026_g7237 [Hermanssonia centrifuga]
MVPMGKDDDWELFARAQEELVLLAADPAKEVAVNRASDVEDEGDIAADAKSLDDGV